MSVKRRVLSATVMVGFAGLVYWPTPVAALFVDMRVIPAAVNITARVETEIELSPADIQRGLPPLADLIPKSPRPRVRVSPTSFSVTWDPRCIPDPNNNNLPESVQSAQGEFKYQGRVLATTGQLNSTMTCINQFGQATVKETAMLPQAVIDLIVEELIDVPVADLLVRPTARKTLTLQYTRDWVGSNVGRLQRMVTLVVNGTLNAEITQNQSRLERADARLLTPQSAAPISRAGFARASVMWTAGVEVMGKGSPLTISSQNLAIKTPSGEMLRTIAKPLTQPVPAGLRSVMFPAEMVAIDTAISQKARSLGANRIVLEREFTDGENRFRASVALSLAGAGSGAFQIFRVGLRFDDGSPEKVVAPGEQPLQAIVDINYNGTGLLRAQWEWARLPAAGRPFFQPLPPASSQTGRPTSIDFAVKETLPLIREFLMTLQRTTLKSPPLPTNEEGHYLLRLSIQSPEVLFVLPEIRYVVAKAVADIPADARRVPLRPLRVIGPEDGAELIEDLQFLWGALPSEEVSAYRLELFEGADTDMEKLVTGVVVPADTTNTQVSALAKQHLQPGMRYSWRITAIDKRGQLSAASPVRYLSMPQAPSNP